MLSYCLLRFPLFSSTSFQVPFIPQLYCLSVSLLHLFTHVIVRWGCSTSLFSGFFFQVPPLNPTIVQFLFIYTCFSLHSPKLKLFFYFFIFISHMKVITAKSPHDSSFSFSRRYFNWKKKVEEDEEEILTFSSSSHFCEEIPVSTQVSLVPAPRKKLTIRSALSLFGKNRSGLGSRVVGTMFGYRRSHVHFAFQEEAKSSPAFLIQLATPTSVLVKEMASGLVRIALECEKKNKGVKLLDEPVWRTYCNGKKCGFAMRRECGPEEWKVLKAVEPISMGAGVLPGDCNGNGGGSEGELMYMRARFERVVGSKDSEAFYMMNPDGSGGPELSVYLLRV